MELSGAIEALKYVNKNYSNCNVKIDLTTDSKYVKDGIESWIIKWKTNGWRTSKRKPVINQDLWRELDSLNTKLKPKWHWVEGHSGNKYNEMVDELANSEAQRVKRLNCIS
jgi:ribonuclease HI